MRADGVSITTCAYRYGYLSEQFQCSTTIEYELLIRQFYFTEQHTRATVVRNGNHAGKQNGSFIIMRVPVGKTIELEVDVTKFGLPRELPENASHIVYIGLRNLLMDAHASVTKSDPDCVTKSRTLAERKLDALYRGQIRTVSAPRAADPIASEIRRLATNIVQKMHAAALAKFSPKDRLAQLRVLVTAYVAEHEKELTATRGASAS